MDTINYAYIRHGELRFATRRCVRASAIAAAAGYLEASQSDAGWTYLAEETGETFLVTDDNMAKLGAAVLAGRASDAYSYWCTSCVHELVKSEAG